MAQQPRQFQTTEAKRERVPLLIGLTGPSGGGKTFSALRLATGIQSVVGGDIYAIDTESRRALHYADDFKFKHLAFNEPFGSLDYLEALQFCVKDGAKTIIVDSMSHEHEGPGGMVDLHDTILQRMAGDDWKKRQAMQMLAWSEPKQKRRQLINGILRLNANFVFCFRAKNTSKPIRGKDGKTEVEKMGYMPIAGEEFVFEQTMNCLLLPGAQGIPTWHSDEIGEAAMIKLPKQFEWLRARGAALDEEVGASLAKWAEGGAPEPRQNASTGQQGASQGNAAQDWASKYLAGISGAQNAAELEEFAGPRAKRLAELAEKHPDLAAQCTKALEDRREDLAEF